MFDLLLLRPAVRFLEGLTDEGDRREVRRLHHIIAQDPFWDQRTKFAFPVPPAIVSLYDNGEFKVVYHIINSAVISIWAIGYSGDRPQLS